MASVIPPPADAGGVSRSSQPSSPTDTSRRTAPANFPNCSKCGAPIPVDAGAKFAKCSYCEGQIYIDRSGAGFFYIIPFSLDESRTLGTFRRWTAGPRMARDLEAAAKPTLLKQSYFPVYLFRRAFGKEEKVFVQPARSTILPGMRNLKIPPGDLKVFDQKHSVGDIEVIEPELSMTAYLDTLPGTPVEQSLVFFPVWDITYDYRGAKFRAVVDGSSGEIFATDFPPRQEAPYLLVGAVSFTLFLIEGLFLPITLVPALLTAPVIAAASYYVAKNL